MYFNINLTLSFIPNLFIVDSMKKMLSIDIIIHNRRNSIYERDKLSLYPINVNIFTNFRFENTIIHFNTKHNDAILPKMFNY